MYNLKLASNQLNYKNTDFLNRLSEFDIYKKYIGDFKVGSVIKSPFRNDRKPSFGIYSSKKNGRLFYHDFSTNEYGGVIDFVMKLENIKFAEAVNKIKSLNIQNIYRKKKYMSHKKNEIGIVRQSFTKEDLSYWYSYFIKESTLNLFNVFSIKYYLFNNIVHGTYRPDSIMFAYKINNCFKIYRPYEKEKKWRNNCTIRDIQGYVQLPDKGDLLVVTKSLKDVMVLYELGYSAIATNSETSAIPVEVMLQLNKKFKKIILFFDNDKAGVEGALNFKNTFKDIEINIFHINESYKVKDISDFIKKYKKTKTKRFLKDEFKKYNK